MSTLLGYISIGIIIALASYILPGVEVAGLGRAIGVGVVIALLSSTVGAIVRLFTLPLNVISLGLVGGLITVGVVLLADSLLSGFSVGGFRNAALFAIIVGICTSVLGIEKEVF